MFLLISSLAMQLTILGVKATCWLLVVAFRLVVWFARRRLSARRS